MLKHIFIALLVAGLFSACSDKNSSTSDSTTGNNVATSAPKTSMEVRLAMPGDYAPMSTFTEKHSLTGFEWELMNEIAKTQGFTVSSQLYSVAQWENQLLGKQSDILSLTFNISPEARAKIELTQPIYSSKLIVGTLASKGEGLQASDFNGKKISVSKLYGQEAINLAAQLTGSEQNVVLADTFHLAAAKMYTGEVDGVLAEDMVFAYYSNTGDRHNIAVNAVDLPNQSKRDISFAVRSEDKNLLNQINEGIQAIQANGKYQEVATKWILKPATGQ